MTSNLNLLINLSLSDISTTAYYVMPPGLMSIAAYLRDNSFETSILDLNVIKNKRSEDEVISIFEDTISEKKPCLVGASIMVSGQFALARKILHSSKKLSPDIVTVVGGAHVSQFPGEILENCPEIDFVIIGEGEEQAIACANYAVTKIPTKDWPGGIAYRSNGKIVINPKLTYIDSVDSLPLPAYDLLNFDDYSHDTTTWHNPHNADLGVRVPIITSRGCPNLCNFCSVAKCMGLPYRPMRPMKVVDMMQMLHETFNVSYFAIFDANFAEESQRVIEICDEINKRNLKFFIDLPTGLPINSTAKEIIDALAGVGLIRTCISVESGDPDIRNSVMKKSVDQNEIYKIVEAVRKHPQIFLLTDFVLGMPEDTMKSMEASYQLITDLDTDDIALSIATPYPGTSLYEQCISEKLFFDEVDIPGLWMKDWYTHANIKKFIIKPYELDAESLCYYRDKILSARQQKTLSYQKRMKLLYNIDSLYGGTKYE